MPADNGGFTTKEIVIRIEEKVDAVLRDHEGRLRVLERRSWRFPASVMTSLAAVVSALAIALTGHS